MNEINRHIDASKKRTLERLKNFEQEINSYDIEKKDLLEIHNCLLCKSNSSTLISEMYLRNELNFCSTNICNNCLFVYRSISPSVEWFKKCWKKIYSDVLQVFNPEMEKVRSETYNKYFELIKRYRGNGKLLDVGSAYGSGAKIFKDKGYIVHSIEAEDNKANYIENVLNIPVVSRTIEDFSSDEKYDVIIFTHCLEHLDDPIDALMKIKNVLHENGIIYLEIPLLWNIVNWAEAFYLTHKNYFIEDNLKRLLIDMNFKILDVSYNQHSEEEPINLGLILGVHENFEQFDFENKFHGNLKDAIDLFKINFPLQYDLKSVDVIKYNVDNIEHFYQTVRLDKNNLKYNNTNKIFSFISKDNIE